MTAHEFDNMASRFPESLSEAQFSEINEKAIPINTKIGLQARSQDFLWGGAYLNNRDQIINVWIIRHGSSEVTWGQSVQPSDH